MKKLLSMCMIALLTCMPLMLCSCQHECIHEITEFIEDTSTCTIAGVKRYQCVYCGEIIEEPSEMLPHDYSVFVSDTATCSAAGEKTYKCANCSATTTSYSEKAEHSWLRGTCFCENCNAVKEGWEKYKIYSTSKGVLTRMDDLDSLYVADFVKSILINITADNGSSTMYFEAFFSAKYSSVIVYYVVSVQDATTKTAVASFSGFTTVTSKNYYIKVSCNMESAYNSSHEYYVNAAFIRYK